MKKIIIIGGALSIIAIGWIVFPYIKSISLCEDIKNSRTEEAIHKIKGMRNVNQATAPKWTRRILNSLEYDIEIPLVVACKEGNIQVVETLLAKGANPNQFYQDGFSPAEAVFTSNHAQELEILKLLVSYGADVSQYGNNISPLFLATKKMVYAKNETSRERYTECVKYLLEYDKQWVDDKGFSVLHYAVDANNFPLMEQLLDEGEYLINESAGNGQTPLFLAVRNNSIETVDYLIQRGADKNVIDVDGKTVYDYAITNGYKEIVELLNIK